MSRRLCEGQTTAEVRALLEIQGKNRYGIVPAPLLNSVRRRLKNANEWRQIHLAILRDGLSAAIISRARSKNSAAADEAQLALPGFEHLPKRISAHGEKIAFTNATVTQFLAYKDRYERRAEKDQETVNELRKLALLVAPYAQSGITVVAGAHGKRA